MGKTNPQIYVFGNENSFNHEEINEEITEDPNHNSKNMILLGKTEYFTSEMNPKFSKTILVNYKYSRPQELLIVVVDNRKPRGKFEDQEVIGEVRCTISGLLSQNGVMTSAITNPKKSNRRNGYVTIRTEELHERMLCLCCWSRYISTKTDYK